MFLKKLFSLVFFSSFLCCYSQTIETLSLKNDSIILSRNWELFYIQNPNATIGTTPPVKIASSLFSADSIDASKYKGICWFKKIFKLDSSIFGKPLSVRVKLIGAAEIFINKQKVQTIGFVSSYPKSETLVNTDRYLFTYKFEPNVIYEVLVHYSNHDLRSSYNSRGKHAFGFWLGAVDTDSSYSHVMTERIQNSTFGTLFIMFFMTLFLIHLVIFLFNKKQKSNAYYACFCLLAALILIGAFSSNYTSLQSVLGTTGLFIIGGPTLLFSFLPYMLRSFFELKFPSWYKLFLILSGLYFVLLFSGIPIYTILFLILVVLSSAESVRNLIIAFKLKKSGVKIIGTGIILFSISILLFIALFWYFKDDNDNVKGGIIGFLSFILLLISVLSIPFSITVFLAYSISLTNKSLARKLVEVEDLSAKSLEQEKEKQNILANQNTVLEKQVTERTVEITEQKKLIEEKNKDIIDSINYAKRIQSAMLPDEAAFKAIFDNSFVLYMPRDIVSGDFYYAAEINRNKLIIAADCTGHGVPGALMSMVGCNIINKLARENNIIEPKIMLETLHTELRQALKQDQRGSLNRDGMDIAAVLINETEILFASANRPLIYFDNNGQLLEIKATKTPVGGSHIESVNIEQHALKRKDIKQLFLFSDGFADQFGGPEGKKLMVSKFKLWLTQIFNSEPAEQKLFLEKHFIEWKNESEQVDDVMVIGIKII